MDIDGILQQIMQLSDARKQVVGEQEASIRALQIQVDVLAAPFDDQIADLKKMLLLHLTESGTPKTMIKTDHLTYSFWYKEDVDMEQLKAMAVEIPQIQQCFVNKPHARLLLK